jgi:hypothetical protein
MISIEDLVKKLLSPVPEGMINRVDGELDLGPRKCTFKAYVLLSRARGNPVDLIRIDIKGE